MLVVLFIGVFFDIEPAAGMFWPILPFMFFIAFLASKFNKPPVCEPSTLKKTIPTFNEFLNENENRKS
ncbi:MAG: hypothetical protein M0R51_01875 [Clostridia bacterium]|nr:hypothetical protein [Clostridia bacterium]